MTVDKKKRQIKVGACFTCGETGHYSAKCSKRQEKKDKQIHLWFTVSFSTCSNITYNIHGSMAENWRAVSGYTFIIHGSAVSWSAKCQEIVSLSTTESKYIAATSAAKEALWLHSLITPNLTPPHFFLIISQQSP